MDNLHIGAESDTAEIAGASGARDARNYGYCHRNLTLNPFRRAKAFLTLVAAVRQWAASEQASPVFFHVMTGTRLAATDRLMKAAGVQCVGGSYVV
ncbi:hypothetical protein [Hoeflea sp.]|uniref:hypothetical protein n=1 Tax=Hoeflea sp. TaxID=1940281 RepID=UPI00374A5626